MASLRHFVFAPALHTHLYNQQNGQQNSPPPASRPTIYRPAQARDEPPQYNSSERPPTYSEPAPRPRQNYRLRQFGRSNQSFVPLGDFSSTIFSLQQKSFSSLLPSRPDMVFSTTNPSDGTKSKSRASEQILAKASFARTGELPWQPRASITLSTALSSAEDIIVMALDRKTSSRWFTTIGGVPHSWYLYLKPYRLVLMREGSTVVADAVAVFTYSVHGTYASGGQAVGELGIAGGNASNDGGDNGGSAIGESEQEKSRYLVEVMLSCALVIAHWRNQGKVFYAEL